MCGACLINLVKDITSTPEHRGLELGMNIAMQLHDKTAAFRRRSIGSFLPFFLRVWDRLVRVLRFIL